MELQKKKQQIDQMRDKHKELEVHVASLLDEAELKARLHGELETKYVLTDSEHDETPLVTRIAAAENTVRSQALALQHMQLALAEKKAEIDTERQKNEADGQCDHQREEMVETLILELNEALRFSLSSPFPTLLPDICHLFRRVSALGIGASPPSLTNTYSCMGGGGGGWERAWPTQPRQHKS